MDPDQPCLWVARRHSIHHAAPQPQAAASHRWHPLGIPARLRASGADPVASGQPGGRQQGHDRALPHADPHPPSPHLASQPARGRGCHLEDVQVAHADCVLGDKQLESL